MTFEQIKENIHYGDYNLLQKLLKVKSVAAARARFLRGHEDAVKAMRSIQENRAQFIKEYERNEKQPGI